MKTFPLKGARKCICALLLCLAALTLGACSGLDTPPPGATLETSRFDLPPLPIFEDPDSIVESIDDLEWELDSLREISWRLITPEGETTTWSTWSPLAPNLPDSLLRHWSSNQQFQVEIRTRYIGNPTEDTSQVTLRSQVPTTPVLVGQPPYFEGQDFIVLGLAGTERALASGECRMPLPSGLVSSNLVQQEFTRLGYFPFENVSGQFFLSAIRSGNSNSQPDTLIWVMGFGGRTGPGPFARLSFNQDFLDLNPVEIRIQCQFHDLLDSAISTTEIHILQRAPEVVLE